MDTIGKRLKYLREKHKVSQEKLAKGACIQRGNISHYEKEDWSPNYETAKKIALFFNVDPDWFFYGSKEVFTNDNVEYISNDETLQDSIHILGNLTENEIQFMKLYRMLDERDKIKIEGIIEEKLKEKRAHI